MNKKFFLGVGIIFAIFLVLLYFPIQTEIKLVTYDLKVNVTDLRVNNSKILIGISGDPYEMNFGTLPENLSVKKFLDLKNNEKIEALIKLSIDGNISDFIEISDTNFILKNGEEKQVEIFFNGTARKGFYEGNLSIEILTPKYIFLAPFSL
jgi:hypothetical protein